MGWSPTGHPHSVGQSGSTHADEALQCAKAQERSDVAFGSVGCCCWLGVLCQQEQNKSTAASTGMRIQNSVDIEGNRDCVTQV